MDIQKELDRAGAVYKDYHFVYKSGKHGPHYINPDKIFPNVFRLDRMCVELAWPFKSDDVGVVTAAATGGIPLAVLTALKFPSGPLAVWADKDGDEFEFQRAGFADKFHGKRVLVVEDLLNTGGSVIKVCRQVEKHGGEVVGVSVICNRGNMTAKTLGVPRLVSQLDVDFTAVEPDECELCKQGVPIVENIGHGDKFKLAHPDYVGSYIKLLG